MVSYKDKQNKKCPKCRQEKRIVNKGLCDYCYQKFERRKIKCKVCRKILPHRARGMCNNCYKREGTPLVRCERCGEIKHHKAKRMCSNCFGKTFHYDRIKAGNYKKYHQISLEDYKEVTRSCIVCGFDKIVDLHHIDNDHNNPSKSNLIGWVVSKSS